MIDALIPAFLGIPDAATILDWFMNNGNYTLVFLLMAVESSFIPFPSEVIVPPAAYLAATSDRLEVWLVIVFATAGALVGALVNYFLSMWIGRPLVYKFADSRLGHACLIDSAKVDRAERYFDKHGAISTFIGRLIPAVRQLISIPAGLARMNLGTFCIFTTLGAGVWNCILAALGWWLGQTVSREALFDTVEKYNGYLTWAGIALAAVCVAIILYNAFKKRPTPEKQPPISSLP